MFRGCRVWSLGFGVLGLEGFRAFMVGSGRDRSSYGFVSDVKLTEMTNTHRGRQCINRKRVGHANDPSKWM